MIARLGFDLIDGRNLLAATFDPPLSPRDSEYLMSKLDGLQWTEAQLLAAIEQFASECGYTVNTTKFLRDAPPSS